MSGLVHSRARPQPQPGQLESGLFGGPGGGGHIRLGSVPAYWLAPRGKPELRLQATLCTVSSKRHYSQGLQHKGCPLELYHPLVQRGSPLPWPTVCWFLLYSLEFCHLVDTSGIVCALQACRLFSYLLTHAPGWPLKEGQDPVRSSPRCQVKCHFSSRSDPPNQDIHPQEHKKVHQTSSPSKWHGQIAHPIFPTSSPATRPSHLDHCGGLSASSSAPSSVFSASIRSPLLKTVSSCYNLLNAFPRLTSHALSPALLTPLSPTPRSIPHGPAALAFSLSVTRTRLVPAPGLLQGYSHCREHLSSRTSCHPGVRSNVASQRAPLRTLRWPCPSPSLTPPVFPTPPQLLSPKIMCPVFASRLLIGVCAL